VARNEQAGLAPAGDRHPHALKFFEVRADRRAGGCQNSHDRTPSSGRRRSVEGYQPERAKCLLAADG
jgi:hypothetical protein